ncbi:MAG TPA: cytochrome P450 [Solirubrobacteraceae bacterium]|nr:cytochrome P450 [Solirubrobacteraceae bacterium]
MSTAADPTLPPGPRYPRALQTFGWIARPGPFMERCQARYGDMFTLRVANEGTWVFLADPAAVKQVFTGDPRLLRAGEANVILGPILGDKSVLLLDEPEHMAQRKLMLPPFHGERMQRYRDLIAEITEREIARWPVGEPLALWPQMQAITLEVIMRAVFGVDEGQRLDRLRERLRLMLDWTTDRSRLVRMAVLGPARMRTHAPLRRVLGSVDEVLLEEIRLRRDDPAVGERDDILSMLVQARHEDGSPMADNELRDELMTLLVAGHETTATSLAWAIERLVRHPDKLARLRDEAASDDDDAYADAVCKETLRLRPVLPIVLRRLTEPMEIGGRMLPAGVSVAPCIYLVHRREDVYPEPRAFRPERFLESPAGTYTWIPFGGGVRRCLGATFALFEMKTVLRTLVTRVQLRPGSPEAERITRRAITMTPGRGAEVVIDATGTNGHRPARDDARATARHAGAAT